MPKIKLVQKLTATKGGVIKGQELYMLYLMKYYYKDKINLNKVCRDYNHSEAQFICHTFAKLNNIVLGLTGGQQKHNIHTYLVTELNVVVNLVSRQ